MRVLFLSLVACLAVPQVFSADLSGDINPRNFSYQRNEPDHFKLLAGLQTASMAVGSTRLNGSGVAFGGSALVGSNFQAHLLFSQAFTKDQTTGNTRSLFSGILSSFSYALKGQFGGVSEVYSLSGRPVIERKSLKSWNLSAGLCFDQYSLNGDDTVYSASGVGYQLAAEIPVKDLFWVQPQLRSSTLSAGQVGTINAQAVLLFFQFQI